MTQIEVKKWLAERIERYQTEMGTHSNGECIQRLAAIVAEARLRLANPNFPSNE